MVEDQPTWTPTPYGGGQPSGGPGGQASSEYSADLGAWINAIAGIFGKSLHPSGSGSMAARGVLEGQIKQARIAARAQLGPERLSAAYASFSRTNPYEAGFAVAVPTEGISPPQKLVAELAAWEKTLSTLEAKKQTKHRIQVEKKLQKRIDLRQNKLAPYTDYRVAELYGANAGYWRERGAPAPLWLSQRSH